MQLFSSAFNQKCPAWREAGINWIDWEQLGKSQRSRSNALVHCIKTEVQDRELCFMTNHIYLHSSHVSSTTFENLWFSWFKGLKGECVNAQILRTKETHCGQYSPRFLTQVSAVRQKGADKLPRLPHNDRKSKNNSMYLNKPLRPEAGLR